MTNDAEALRVTSDALLDDLETLEALEQEKRTASPGEARLVELAREIERIARRVVAESVGQRRLTEDVHAQAASGAPDAPTAPIAETPRETKLILADWRDAERRLGESVPGSPEALASAADVERFRSEYRWAFDEARRRDA